MRDGTNHRHLAARTRSPLHVGRRVVAALAVSAALGAALPARAQEDLGEPGVTKSPSGYSVNVTGGDLVRVLAAIGGSQGFSVIDEARNRQPLTVAISDVPLDDALHRLLRSENYVIVYRGGEQHAKIKGDAIERIILLSPAGAAPAAKTNASPLAGPAVATGAAKPGAPVPVPAVAPAARQVRPAPDEDDEESVPAIGFGVKQPPAGQPDQSAAAAAAAMARMRGSNAATAVQIPGDPTVSAVADAFGRPLPAAPPGAPPAVQRGVAPVPVRPVPPDDADGDEE